MIELTIQKIERRSLNALKSEAADLSHFGERHFPNIPIEVLMGRQQVQFDQFTQLILFQRPDWPLLPASFMIFSILIGRLGLLTLELPKLRISNRNFR